MCKILKVGYIVVGMYNEDNLLGCQVGPGRGVSFTPDPSIGLLLKGVAWVYVIIKGPCRGRIWAWGYHH